MIPEIGNFALMFALGIAVLAALLPLLASYKSSLQPQLSLMRPLAFFFFLLLSVSMLCLFYSLVNNDFTVQYVANHSNSMLPTRYKIAALWGGHEGSLLLWIWILALWLLAVANFSGSLSFTMKTRVLSVMFAVAIGFLLFIILTSNPFDRYLPFFPADGKDLNPLLQDVGLIVHPPMLYMGYVGFSVAFAFAIAGLWTGQLDQQWARWARPWVLAAWAFLTLGIALGSWWAYYELGWGGWWFWDPVENASFMPWLAGVALLHSLSVSDKRNAFKAWTILLAILSFSLSLLGTFLVRSGVLTSVHAFANDPERGLFILIFLCVVIGGSLSLFAMRAQNLKSKHHFNPLSRESFILVNNVLLCIALSCVLIGTIYPLIAAAFEWRRVSVGPPYFNRFFVPLSLLACVFIAFAPRLMWGQHSKPVKGWMLNLIASLVLALLLPYALFQDFHLGIVVTTGLCLFVLLHLFMDVFEKVRARSQNPLRAWLDLTSAYKGMVFAHIGFVLLILGAAYTTVYSVEKDIRMNVGETATLGAYEFTFKNFKQEKVENYLSGMADIALSKNGHFQTFMYPEKRFYAVQNNVMTEAAIKAGLFADIYVSLGEELSDGSWSMRLYYKPFVRFVWLGCLLMALGGFLALKDKRYRRKARLAQEVNSAQVSSQTNTQESLEQTP